MSAFRKKLGEVCLRPRMYVGRADFKLAAAFLSGYEFAIDELCPDQKGCGLSGFTPWLAVHLDSCVRSGWDEILLHEEVGPDKFEALLRLYDEFSRDRAEKGLQAIRDDYERLVERVFRKERNRVCWCEQRG